MGMFDYVNFKMDCPKCGKEVSGFQTKRSYCELVTIDPVAIDNFYTSCSSCHAWIEFTKELPEEPIQVRPEPYTADEVAGLGFTMSIIDK